MTHEELHKRRCAVVAQIAEFAGDELVMADYDKRLFYARRFGVGDYEIRDKVKFDINAYKSMMVYLGCIGFEFRLKLKNSGVTLKWLGTEPDSTHATIKDALLYARLISRRTARASRWGTLEPSSVATWMNRSCT